MDATEGTYAEWNKLDAEKETLHFLLIYVGIQIFKKINKNKQTEKKCLYR